MKCVVIILVLVCAEHALGHDCDPIWSCNFDSNNVCDMVQSTTDDEDWTVQSGHTPSGGTGPQGNDASVSGNGYYIYTEAIGKAEFDTFIIKTPQGLDLAGAACIDFFVYTYGSLAMPAKLEVLALTDYDDEAGGVVLATYATTNDEGWRNEQIVPQDMVAVAFKMTRGQSFQADFALDAIRICSIDCPPKYLGECAPGNPDVNQCVYMTEQVDEECTPALGWGYFYAQYHCSSGHLTCRIDCIEDIPRPAECDGIEEKTGCNVVAQTPCDKSCGIGEYTKTYGCTGVTDTTCPYLCCCKECSPGLDMFPSLTPCSSKDSGAPVCE